MDLFASTWVNEMDCIFFLVAQYIFLEMGIINKAAITHDRHFITLQLSHDSRMSFTSVWKVLKRKKCFFFLIPLHQEHHGNDF